MKKVAEAVHPELCGVGPQAAGKFRFLTLLTLPVGDWVIRPTSLGLCQLCTVCRSLVWLLPIHGQFPCAEIH
jgi:hypothetical protein